VPSTTRSEEADLLIWNRYLFCHNTLKISRIIRGGRKRLLAKDHFRPILLKKSTSVSMAEKYTSEIEIRILRRRFRAQI
jgi:hypothetical protein